MTGHWPDALTKPSACLSQMERQDGNACSSTAVVAMNAREDVPSLRGCHDHLAELDRLARPALGVAVEQRKILVLPPEEACRRLRGRVPSEAVQIPFDRSFPAPRRCSSLLLHIPLTD